MAMTKEDWEEVTRLNLGVILRTRGIHLMCIKREGVLMYIPTKLYKNITSDNAKEVEDLVTGFYDQLKGLLKGDE